MAKEKPSDGAIAQYDDRQKSILKGEVVGIVAFTVMALIGVVAVSRAVAINRPDDGFRAEYNYNYGGVQKVGFADYLTSIKQKQVAPSAEALAAYNKWVAANPKTLKAHVLKDYLGDKYADTAAVFGFMSAYVVPGVGQSCEYCHNLENFSLYEKPTKLTAEAMLVMTFELQKKWVNTIPRPEGQKVYNIMCASCHAGQAKFWNNKLKSDPKNYGMFGIEGGDQPAGYNFIDDQFAKTRVEADGSVNWFKAIADKPKDGKGLYPTVRNQYAMYHMNGALGVGCDFCHYGGYFRSYALEDGTFKWPKTQARHMMGMLQDISVNWLPQMPSPEDATKKLENYASPNCYMCHRGNVVPPGDYEFNEPIKDVANPLIKPIEDLKIAADILPPKK